MPGHWEGDLIIGAENKSAIGTLVERATRFVMLLHLPDGTAPMAVQDAMVEAMSQLPAHAAPDPDLGPGHRDGQPRRDRRAPPSSTIYFCDPHSPWQRGTNENTNGLLRQYFPKGTDLSGYHRRLPRPRRRPAQQPTPQDASAGNTPAEALDELLSDPTNPPGVALTG